VCYWQRLTKCHEIPGNMGFGGAQAAPPPQPFAGYGTELHDAVAVDAVNVVLTSQRGKATDSQWQQLHRVAVCETDSAARIIANVRRISIVPQILRSYQSAIFMRMTSWAWRYLSSGVSLFAYCFRSRQIRKHPKKDVN